MDLGRRVTGQRNAISAHFIQTSWSGVKSSVYTASPPKKKPLVNHSTFCNIFVIIVDRF